MALAAQLESELGLDGGGGLCCWAVWKWALSLSSQGSGLRGRRCRLPLGPSCRPGAPPGQDRWDAGRRLPGQTGANLLPPRWSWPFTAFCAHSVQGQLFGAAFKALRIPFQGHLLSPQCSFPLFRSHPMASRALTSAAPLHPPCACSQDPLHLACVSSSAYVNSLIHQSSDRAKVSFSPRSAGNIHVKHERLSKKFM